jgi:hypothetical protein
MGREAVAICEWEGLRAEARALLESAEIILRGAIKAKIPRAEITAVQVAGDVLSLRLGNRRLILELGSSEAAKWLNALSKPPATLAEKLGVSATKPAYVMGKLQDPEIAAAFNGAQAASVSKASALLAVIDSNADLESAFKLADTSPGLMLWCVYPKGKAGGTTDAGIRTFMRSHGYMDNKSCAVSATLTATRYGRKSRS